MTFYLIGIDYKKAGTETLRRAHKTLDDIKAYCATASPGRTEVLSTCNRVEVYGIAGTLTEAGYEAEVLRMRFPDIFGNAYIRLGRQDVYIHAINLAAGLESQLKGEFQIVRQLEAWIRNKNFQGILSCFWTEVLTTAMKIRDEAGLGRDAVNIADIIFKDLKRQIADRAGAKILVIGTGKVAELIARRKPRWARIDFASRKKHRKAETIARFAGGEVISLSRVPGRLNDIDAVICATSSPHPVLRRFYFHNVIGRRNRPLYIYDLATISDVAPGVADIDFNIVFGYEDVVRGALDRHSGYKERIDRAGQLIREELRKRGLSHEDKYRYTARQACACAG